MNVRDKYLIFSNGWFTLKIRSTLELGKHKQIFKMNLLLLRLTTGPVANNSVTGAVTVCLVTGGAVTVCPVTSGAVTVCPVTCAVTRSPIYMSCALARSGLMLARKPVLRRSGRSIRVRNTDINSAACASSIYLNYVKNKHSQSINQSPKLA